MTLKRNNRVLCICATVLVVCLMCIGGIYLVRTTQKRYYVAAYPMKFSELVEKYSEEYEIDESFVYSVIRTESSFNPDAVSSIGARGLMQFTSNTFDWVKWRMNDSADSFDSMFDPETSIKYGCYLLSYLSQKYTQRAEVICAYHAGMNCVDQWLDNKEYSDDGLTLNYVPYGDTRNYLKTVTETEKMYTNLYFSGED